VTAAVKTFGPFAIKSEPRGEVEAVFSTFNVVDKDGDWTLPGAFTDGAEVLISAYGHSSWGGQLPVGKGVIKTTATDARLVGKFFLETQGGRDTFATIRALGGLAQYSYGFDILEKGELTDELRQRGVRRVLPKLKVHEVSPVLLAAGVGTRTVATKCTGCGDVHDRGATCRCDERATIDAAIALVKRDTLLSARDRARWLAAFQAEHDVPEAVAVSAKQRDEVAAIAAFFATRWGLAEPAVRFFKRSDRWNAGGWFLDWRPGEIWIDAARRDVDLVQTVAHELSHYARHQLKLANDERAVAEDTAHLVCWYFAA
jgi:hypothetical protein